MSTYVILSKVSPDALKDPSDSRKLARSVSDKIKSACPDVKWRDSFALMGRFDVMDIVEAEDPAAVEKAAMVIRCYGHAQTETMQATPWRGFVESM